MVAHPVSVAEIHQNQAAFGSEFWSPVRVPMAAKRATNPTNNQPADWLQPFVEQVPSPPTRD